MPSFRGLLILALLIWAACGGAASSGPESAATPRRSSFSLITYEELREHGGYSNLYDLIEVLRPRWLRAQGGPDTFFGTPGQVQVRMDGNRMGDVAVLRTLSPSGVTSIQWVAPIDAAGRYGLDHSHGAIIVSTRPVH
ncbi:MAG: hypothetical protein KY466_07965 [Gemmatimonadetes bacterium]|nr:hypothetical protein [Gemmatimonadota bacterium]